MLRLHVKLTCKDIYGVVSDIPFRQPAHNNTIYRMVCDYRLNGLLSDGVDLSVHDMPVFEDFRKKFYQNDTKVNGKPLCALILIQGQLTVYQWHFNF